MELQQNSIGLGLELGRLTQDDAIAEYERLVPLASGSAPAQFNLGQALLPARPARRRSRPRSPVRSSWPRNRSRR